MNILQTILLSSALTVSTSVFATDNKPTFPKIDEIPANLQSFPEQATATELTDAEREQAAALRRQAADIYSDVLSYDSEARAQTVSTNLSFINGSIATTEQRLKTEVANYKSLSKNIYDKGQRIKAMKVTEELKNKRLIELQDSYEQLKDTMTYKINMLKERIAVLKTRRESYSYEKINLDQINKEKGKSAPLNWDQKDKKRKEQALTTLDQIENDLINKEFDKLLK